MKKYIFVFMALVLISGCGYNKKDRGEIEQESTFNEKEEFIDAAAIEADNLDLNMSFDKSYALYICVKNNKDEMYEPEQGCYLGANIVEDRTISSDIEEFEVRTLKEHSLYANDIKLGDDYPYSWILECVSKEKTPVLTINIPNSYSPFQNDLLDKTAKEAGELNIPMFIQFYPYSSNDNYKAEDYIDFYRKAYALFKKYAPNAAFIWGVSDEDVYNCLSYYPGDSYIDWVSLNIVQKIDEFGGELYRPILKDIDFFYYSFQKKKPIMISNFSVSHYSTENVQYYTNEAAAEINKIYKNIAEKYPRIKAIIYKSYNEIDSKETAEDEGEKTYNNFLLEDEEFILDSYRDGISKDRYINVFNSIRSNDVRYDFMRSPFFVYSKGEEFFLSEKSLEYDLGLVGLSLLEGGGVYINGDKYYSLDKVQKYLDIEYEIDDLKDIFILSKG